MAITFEEFLGNWENEDTKIPDGDFRSLVVKIQEVLKVYYKVDELPLVEEVFRQIILAIKSAESKVGVHDQPIISITDFEVDTRHIHFELSGDVKNGSWELESDSPGLLSFSDIQRLNPDNLQPSWREVIAALVNNKSERYSKLGVEQFLADFVWWGWQAWLSNPDGIGEGDKSFVVSKQVGLEVYDFWLTIIPQHNS